MGEDQVALPGGWTYEKLKAKSADELYVVWTNARKQNTKGGDQLAEFIEKSGLDYTPSGGISMSDPRVIEMTDIIGSPASREAMKEATASGLPALAGVEPMLVAQMGARYAAVQQITLTAGGIVADVMREMGFKKADRDGKMPQGSVAKTAAMWL